MLLSQRFPILFLFALVPCVPWPRGERLGLAYTAAAAAIAVASIAIMTVSVGVQFEARELGDFDDALAVMEPAEARPWSGLRCGLEDRPLVPCSIEFVSRTTKSIKGGVVALQLRR